MSCLPCEKEAVDGGMGAEAARFAREVWTGVAPHVAAANFYIRVSENILSPLAKRLLGSDDTATASERNAPKYKLSADQLDRLMKQIDKQCYRADVLIAWTTAPQSDTTTMTKQILGWVKADQSFYTDLLVELGPKPTKA